MNIDYLIQLLGNRLNALMLAKDQAFSAGDLERINSLDAELNSVNDTLAKLSLLNAISQVATSHATSEASIVAAGVEAVQKGIYKSDFSVILEGYDISSYATDPLHEQKISAILKNMPTLANAEEIDAYIQSIAPGSPVTAAMVLAAVNAHHVDLRMILALMQQDSSFGTAGLATSTLNPGNVGNTGSAIRYYASWPEGVMAVAEWLSRHRAIKAEEIQEVVEPVEELKVVVPVENQEEIVEENINVEEVVKPEIKPEVATSTEETIIAPTDDLLTNDQVVNIKKTTKTK